MKREWLLWAQQSALGGGRAFIRLAPWPIALAYLGHVSVKALAATSVAAALLFAWATMLWRGLSIAQTALISQSMGQSSSMAMHGWLGLSACAGVGVGTVLAALCPVIQYVLHFFGLSYSLSSISNNFSLYLIPVMLFESVNNALRTYLTSIQLFTVPTVVDLAALFIYVIVSYFLIFEGMSNALEAAALAWILSSAVSFLALFIYIRYFVWNVELMLVDKIPDYIESHYNRLLTSMGIFEGEDGSIVDENNDDIEEYEHRILSSDLYSGRQRLNSRTRNDKETPFKRAISYDRIHNNFKLTQWISDPLRWKVFSGLAIQFSIKTFAVTICVLIMSMASVKLGGPAIAAHNAVIALYISAYTIVYGMYETTALRVEQFSSQSDVRQAKNVILISMASSSLWAIILAIIGFYSKRAIARAMSSDSDVIAHMETIIPYACCCYAIVSVGSQMLGILEGQGRGKELAFAYIFGTWAIAIPLFFLSLHFTHFGLKGLWGSFIIGTHLIYYVRNFHALKH